MALVGASGAAAWRAKAGASARSLAAAAAGVLIASHLFLLLFVHGVFGSPAAMLALEDRGAFLSRKLEYYPCAAYTGTLASDAKILVVGEQRGYYIRRAHLSTTVHAPNLYVRRANEAASSEALASALRADGFTHLLFVPREARRLAEGVGVFTEQGEANWKGLEKHLRLAYQGPACLLAELAAP
jgi:hypothetical protein